MIDDLKLFGANEVLVGSIDGCKLGTDGLLFGRINGREDRCRGRCCSGDTFVGSRSLPILPSTLAINALIFATVFKRAASRSSSSDPKCLSPWTSSNTMVGLLLAALKKFMPAVAMLCEPQSLFGDLS